MYEVNAREIKIGNKVLSKDKTPKGLIIKQGFSLSPPHLYVKYVTGLWKRTKRLVETTYQQ